MLKYFKCFWMTFFAGVLFLPLYAKRPHPLAFKKFGIRIVAVTGDSQQEKDFCEGAYNALVLLEQYDNKMLDRVKKHIRIICLGPTNRNARHIPTYRLYFINILRFPASFPTGKLPTEIAGFLVRQATLAKFKGCTAYYDKVNGAAILEVCRNRQLLTKQKLEQAVRESKASDK